MVVHASEASLITQLEDVLQQRMAVSPGDLGLLYCQRFGTPVVQVRTLMEHPEETRAMPKGAMGVSRGSEGGVGDSLLIARQDEKTKL